MRWAIGLDILADTHDGHDGRNSVITFSCASVHCVNIKHLICPSCDYRSFRCRIFLVWGHWHSLTVSSPSTPANWSYSQRVTLNQPSHELCYRSWRQWFPVMWGDYGHWLDPRYNSNHSRATRAVAHSHRGQCTSCFNAFAQRSYFPIASWSHIINLPNHTATLGIA